MGVRSFDEWIAPSGSNLRERATIKLLSNATIAIEADHYLDYIMKTPGTEEPLLSAIGGLPFGLKTYLQNHVAVWRKHSITPFFVFSGVDGWQQDDPISDAEDNGRIDGEAWAMYDQGQPQEAVATFGKSASVKPKHIARFLQALLRELSIPFTVAPYSAWAQLAYLEKNMTGAIDAIYGASECFLFDVDKLIIEWDFQTEHCLFVRKRDLLENLQLPTPDIFLDTLLLSGSNVLPTLPALYQRSSSGGLVKAARDFLMKNQGPRSGYQALLSIEKQADVQRTQYIKRYQKARMAIKHHLVITKDGRIQMLNEESAPGDLHEIFGQRLPDELYAYLGNGLISPRLPTFTASRLITQLPPLAGGEYGTYRSLVAQNLRDVRQAAQGLLSCSLSRWFQRTDVEVKCWFDAQDAARSLSIIDFVEERENRNIGSFSVRAESFAETTQKLQRGLIGITALALDDKTFVSKSVTRREPEKPRQPLTHKDEIMFNSLWRMLRLRGFVDVQHNLTEWGKVLVAALSALNGTDMRLEESVFLAVELARLGLLTPDDYFPEYNGVPSRPTDAVKRNTLLVSRIACFSQLEHAPVGFTGPLSRGLLAYHSIICATREAMRDLTESCIATLMLNGDADRDRKDFTEMGLDLPFLHHNDCGLGIAVVSYLGELCDKSDSTSAEAKKQVHDKLSREWFPHAQNLSGDLTKAMVLFEAIYEGVKAGGPSLFKQHAVWEETHSWLQGLKPVHDT